MDLKNERLKELRKALGKSTTELGANIGISASGISNIECGIRVLSDKHIKLICAAFPQVSETWLRTGEGDMFNPSSATDIAQLCHKYELGDFAEVVLSSFVKLSSEKRATILDFLRTLGAEYSSGEPQRDSQMSAEESARREADAYYQELLAEKKEAEKSSASQDSNICDA